jgi:hypothetical protein
MPRAGRAALAMLRAVSSRLLARHRLRRAQELSGAEPRRHATALRRSSAAAAAAAATRCGCGRRDGCGWAAASVAVPALR